MAGRLLRQYGFDRPAWDYETTKLRAKDGAAQDVFGGTVAIEGDTVVVGAGGDDIGANVDRGSAYVFVRDW
jgi:hypothetical protein